jgi:hypothetical protein
LISNSTLYGSGYLDHAEVEIRTFLGQTGRVLFVPFALFDRDAYTSTARIVQAADFNDQLDNHPAARGLQLINRGFPMVTSNDNETAERAAFVYDALYASIKQAQTKP